MKGWEIFVHSVRLVLRNLDAAFKVSAVLYLVQVASALSLYFNPPPDFAGGEVPTSLDGVAQNFFLGLLAVIASLWIAVAWHRYVLAEEHPQGWVPRWHGSNMLSYLGRSILIAIIVVLGVTVAALPVGLLAAMLPGLAGLIAFALIGFAGYLFFRLGVMLPAAAVGRPIKLGEAWEATKADPGAIFVLALIVIGTSLLIQLPSLVGGSGTIIDLVYRLVTGWFATIIGISVLTTLYGHYVEGRPID